MNIDISTSAKNKHRFGFSHQYYLDFVE